LQQAVTSYLQRTDYRSYAARLAKKYQRRQAVLVDSLRKELPANVTISRPDGGLNLWIALPCACSAADFYVRAVERGVAFTAGEVFFPDVARRGTIRLSFGLNHEAQLVEGARRLGAVVQDLLKVSKDAVPLLV
jgi:2-aminoadipate transaminase